MAWQTHLEAIDKKQAELSKQQAIMELTLERIEAKIDEMIPGVNLEPIKLAPEDFEPPAETPEQVAERIDYNAYSASEIIERVDSLTSWERQMLIEYEKAHDNRKTVLAALG